MLTESTKKLLFFTFNGMSGQVDLNLENLMSIISIASYSFQLLINYTFFTYSNEPAALEMQKDYDFIEELLENM